jgi:hypothetical protein
VFYKIYIKARIGKYFSDCFLSKNVLKRAALSPLVFNFALEYDITNVQENQLVLKFSGTHQFLAYADDVSPLGGNISIIN